MSVKTVQQNIPSGWNVKLLGKVIVEKDKSILKVGDADNSSVYPFFTSGEKVLSHSKALVSGRNIYVATGGVANIKFFDGEASYSTDTYCFTSKEDTEFIYYALLNNLRDINKHLFSGSGLRHLQKKDFKKKEILLPPITEQQKIAEILSSVDDDIRATQDVIDQNEQIKKGLMQDLFTKGIGHTKFKDSELGKIPEEWQMVHLEDVAHFTNGKGHEKHISKGGKYIVVNSKFISSNGNVIKCSDKAFLPLSKEEVVMVMSDVPNGQALAKCFFIDEDDTYTLNQRICSFRFKTGLPRFYYHLLNRNAYFLKFNNGTGQTNLRKQQVLDCPIALPPEGEQREIVDFLDALEHKLVSWQEKKIVLENLKDGLMQDLLSGEVRVE